MPLISIIVPNYNHAAFLEKRINSILDQTFRDFELILLDDKSTDDSKSVLEQFRNHPKVSAIVYNDANSGSTFRQWKKGIAMAKADWIWIAESDDWADKDFLATVTGALSDASVVLSYSRTMSVLDDREPFINTWGEAIDSSSWQQDQKFSGQSFNARFLKFRNVLPNASAVIFKKSTFNNIDDILAMRYAGDWLLWINIAAQGSVAYSAKPLNYFRRHVASTRSVRSFGEETQRIREYFICIMAACKILNTPFKAFDKHYDWIIAEWISRVSFFTTNEALRPPYPLLFLLRYYKKYFIRRF